MMPLAQQVHARLQKLQGAWVGNETIHPTPFDPVGGQAMGRAINRSGLGGLCMIQEYQQYRGGSTSFEGHGVFWYDAAQDRYALTWFDSMSGAAPTEFRGEFSDDVLSLVARSPQGVTRATYRFAEAHRYRFTMEVSGDGEQWTEFMTGEYERVTG